MTTARIGAHEVVPTAAVYCATKFAAWAVTEGLRQEGDPSIRVTTVSPGVVASELADADADDATRRGWSSAWPRTSAGSGQSTRS